MVEKNKKKEIIRMVLTNDPDIHTRPVLPEDDEKTIVIDCAVLKHISSLDKLKGTYQYLIILEHKSLYGSYINDSRVYTTLRPQWDILFDKYHVDLVISGHDHMYARTYKLYNGIRAKDDEDGTYYLDLGSSGNKARIPDDALYNDGLHECVLDLKTSCMACGAIINVSKEKMAVIIYNNEGKAVDNFIINNRKDMTI